jgi:integrase
MNTRQNQSPSFGSFITGQYIPNIKCFKRSWRTDESLLRIHVFPLLATRLIGQIELTGIISVVCRMQEAGYSSGSINRVLAVLRRAFNLALKWQVSGVSGNPVSGLSVGPDILRSRFLSLEEAHRLIAALEADENRVAANAILLLLLTGARRNEITHAKWDDVNWGSKDLVRPGFEDRSAEDDCAFPLRDIPVAGAATLAWERVHLSLADHRPTFSVAAFSLAPDQKAGRLASSAIA